jgi:hypothetical protein
MNRNSCVALLTMVLSAGLAPRNADAQTSAIDEALLREVQVNLVNGGQQRGVLVTISADALVIRNRGRETKLLLGQVESVVRRTRHVREDALLGALIGFPAGMLILACEPGVNDDCPSAYSWWYLDGPLGAGVGAAVGAVIGKIRASSDKYVVYRRPRTTAQLAILPVVSARVRGLNVAIRW